MPTGKELGRKGYTPGGRKRVIKEPRPGAESGRPSEAISSRAPHGILSQPTSDCVAFLKCLLSPHCWMALAPLRQATDKVSASRCQSGSLGYKKQKIDNWAKAKEVI